jgi:hypothetical protein
MISDFRTQQSAFDASTAFRVAPGFQATALVSQLPRRERWVFLLLDGRRSVAQVAHLTQRSELDVATVLARFLHRGYIEPVHAMKWSSGREAGERASLSSKPHPEGGFVSQ